VASLQPAQLVDTLTNFLTNFSLYRHSTAGARLKPTRKHRPHCRCRYRCQPSSRIMRTFLMFSNAHASTSPDAWSVQHTLVSITNL
jgi:hypothetical protein